ncbi:MAG TPA: response regulator [Verrucomicrobiae bacterium]|jgi:HD-like signal output (HDOD) protein|nr:response regulator [Verrucomicrobiae bacterium]
MKKCILFAGRDDILWEEFNTYASQPASGWVPHFARTGHEALQLGEKHQFAAIVSAFKLPDMTGLELLDNLMDRQPKASRIILSDASESRSTVECIGRAHHHLFKPCELETLKKALDRAGNERWAPSDALKGLLGGMRQVPSPPTIYFQVVAEMQSKNVSLEKVAELVEQDPALTAKILQLANSAVFSLQMQVTDPLEAMSYVGLQTTKALVLMSHTFSTFHELRLAGFSVDTLWAHSVLAGAFARRIAQIETTDEKVIEEAFAAGLLHDFGKLLIGANQPERLGQILTHATAERCSFAEAEAQVFTSFGHAEIGACLLAIWWLPQSIVEAVAFHHQPGLVAGEGFSAVTAVHAADILAHEALADRFGIPPSKLDVDYLKAQGLEGRWELWRQHCLSPQQKNAA